jgi:Mrp family chromosome partitioning ATPase/uncharacterized protein involved in exopolysaccharide biosynthesis
MGFKDYLSIISRRWKVFLPILVLVVGAHLLWVNFGQVPLYRADSMVMITPPIAGATSLLPRPSAQLMSRPETFCELPVLSIAAQILTGERPFTSKEFEDPARQEVIKRFTERIGAEMAGGDSKRLASELEGCMTVFMSKDDRVATIRATCQSPLKALAYAWATAEAARIFYNEQSRETVQKAVGELKSQRAKLDGERDLVLRDRTEFAKRTGFTNFPRYQEMVQGIILTIEGEISQLRASAREMERAIDERVAKSQQGGDEIYAVTAEVGASPRLKDLNEAMVKARIEYDIASSRLTDRHPELAVLRSKVEKLEQLISREEETIVAEGMKKWNSDTRELVKQSAGIDLKLEMLKERKASLTRELFRLAEISQEYYRIDDQASHVAANIERVQGQINDLEWVGIQALGQLQLHILADSAKSVESRGAGAGPLALTVFMAILFALGVIYVLEYIDTRVRSEQDIRRFLGLPLLGVIPNQKNHLMTGGAVVGDVAEKFNISATLIRSTARELGMKSFVVTSSAAKEGKTTVSVNLAVSLARKGAKVILVDGDLRVPRVHEVFNIPNKTGLSTLLESRLDPRRVVDGILAKARDGEESIGAAEALAETEVENLSVLTSGPPSDTPVRLLESDRMHRLLRELGSLADFVIFDSPPVNRVGDALTIAGLVDGTIFVVGSGQCDQSEISWAKHLLLNVQANLLGVFLNRTARRIGGKYGYPYRYYRQSSESQSRTPVPV